MLNQVILIGRLTKEPDLQYTKGGTAWCRFTLAVDRPPRKDEEKKADFIRVLIWNKQAENAANYLHKGSLAAVVGHLEVSTYEVKGDKRTSTEVVAERLRFLDPPKKYGTEVPTEDLPAEWFA